ncbi:MAG: AI-2E family transporter [Anaerolineae bacterium]|nr:AI-2E family transporter [Anaerolineae bacterium]
MSIKSHSPNWSNTTKVFVAAFTLVLILLAAWRFQQLINTLIGAGIIAYILNPIIVWLERHTPLKRGAAIAIVYPIFGLAVLSLLIAAGVTLYQQTWGLIEIIQELILTSPDWTRQLIREPIQIGRQTIDLSQLNFDLREFAQQLVAAIQPMVSQSAQFLGVAATITISWLAWAILLFVLSIYFAIDLPRFGQLISDSVHQPDYRRDVEHLLQDTKRIWNGYLRGQTTLAVLMAVIYTIMLNLLGVNYSLPLGILAGVLDFFPYVGPFVIIVLSAVVAFFQEGNWLGLSPLWFSLVVLTAGFILQQIEGNWLNPRIVGGATGLHPLLVIVGAIMGSALAGLLGVMLAAPILATLKLLGTYVWRKMFDLDPFPESEHAGHMPPAPSTAEPLAKSVSEASPAKQRAKTGTL